MRIWELGLKAEFGEEWYGGLLMVRTAFESATRPGWPVPVKRSGAVQIMPSESEYGETSRTGDDPSGNRPVERRMK